MIENIAILVGVFAVLSCTVSFIVLLLLKKNIKDILQKDALVFDKNFEIKKNAITDSFNIVDEVLVTGKSQNMSNAHIEKAIKCYNDLLCVVSNSYIADEFYNIALNSNYDVNYSTITSYKMACRADIGLKGKSTSIKKVKNANVGYVQPAPQTYYQPPTSPAATYTQQSEQPAQPRPVQQRPVQSSAAQPRPAVRPAQPRPAVRPAQPRQVARPTNPDEKK